jgi:hypothetical protein
MPIDFAGENQYSLLVVALIPIAARALRKGLISNQRVALRDPEYLVFLFSMTLSEIPAIFGFLLFVLGAPLAVCTIFAAISLTLMFVYSVHEAKREKPAG